MSSKQASHATKSNFGSKGWLMIVIAGLDVVAIVLISLIRDECVGKK